MTMTEAETSPAPAAAPNPPFFTRDGDAWVSPSSVTTAHPSSSRRA
jgi:hypothetical protein